MTSSLEPRSSHDWRDVGRLEEIQKIRGSSRTSRLVWVSATLYGDGVRRRCATRCPRPLVDLLATQCPRLRRLSGSAVAPKLEQASACAGAYGTLPFSVLGFCRGGTTPTPPACRLRRRWRGVGGQVARRGQQ